MATIRENGKYYIQVCMTRDEYEILRKKAYEMEMTVNRAVKELAIRAARK